MRLPALLLITLLLVSNGRAIDQKGAESTKTPKSAAIVVAADAGKKERQIGNVQVTYSDGTKDVWTTKANCSLARVAADGTVGWTVHGPETKIAASYTMRPNGKLVLNRKGKLIAEIESGKAFIEEWMFIEPGKQIVLLTRGAHGPADIELHDTKTGKLIESVKAFAENLPAWAKPYEEK
jgi:hypothetical protein